MEFEICWRITHKMLVVFRIMSAVKSKGASAKIAMEVFYLVRSRVLAHDNNVGFDPFLMKSSGLSHKTFDDRNMILG